ncbi:MAG: DNA modification methylase [Leptospiraceae bacterium]|nr:MAG: DNA modification methylase [Leptospiraceae bacterium]
MLAENYSFSNSNYKSLDLFKLVANNLNVYKNEDKLYFKPKDVKEWFYEWDFKEYNPNIYSHGFHQYPAKFIPQLARKLLRLFTNENSVVLDIFMGSGTTLIESILLNRKLAIGIELNPFACFMAKVKTTLINPDVLLRQFYVLKTLFFQKKDYEIYTFHNIEYWFKEKQIMDLSKLREIIMSLEEHDIRDFFLLCMSEVVRRVSLTNHNGFKLHRDKEKIKDSFNPDVFGYFENVSIRNINLMKDFFYKALNSKTEVKIIFGDSRKKQNIESNSIDFILTSPPYGDSRTTVAYGQFSRLPWQWIKNDKNIYKLDEKLLGGKIKSYLKWEILEYSNTLKLQYSEIKTKDYKRAKEVISFYMDLYESLLRAYDYLKKDKYFVIVSGNRTVKKVFLRTDLIISEMAEKIGFKTEKILYRNIINKRMPLKNSPTNVKGELSNTMLKENIIFLRKE